MTEGTAGMKYIEAAEDGDFAGKNEHLSMALEGLETALALDWHGRIAGHSEPIPQDRYDLPQDGSLQRREFFPELTAREYEVLELLAQTGYSDSSLAGSLRVKRFTVKYHLSSVYAKLGAKNRVSAMAMWHSRTEINQSDTCHRTTIIGSRIVAAANSILKIISDEPA